MDSCKSYVSLANGFKVSDGWIVVGCIGRQSDLESCLLTFGVRNYDPMTDCFLSIDPIWEAYPGMSPYAYCGNSRNVLIDPSGFGGIRVRRRPTPGARAFRMGAG
jgi:RHS repeat-associated protein